MDTVVHLVSGDESEHETALNIAENLLADESGSIDDVAIVAQAKGIEAVSSAGDHTEQVASLLDDGVAISGCSNTLEAMGMAESDLIDGVETVPEGAVEVTRLESEEGYAYLRP
ncbi:DsrE family protein [Halobaculum rarum]|uniref:DsrE family protein n=1 Tax=Halobaculum rarum TaxID=3075122 RepID=UPI0032AECF6E